MVGSGAWKFQEWRQGESVTLVRNDDYYQKVPYLDAYVIRIWPDQTAVVNALLNGEIDAAVSSRPTWRPSRRPRGLAVATYPTRELYLLPDQSRSRENEFFLDQRVRQALFSALDRESIVNDILLGNAEVAQGTQPVISYAYAPDRIATNTPSIRRRPRRSWPRPDGPTPTATASSTRMASRSPSR